MYVRVHVCVYAYTAGLPLVNGVFLTQACPTATWYSQKIHMLSCTPALSWISHNLWDFYSDPHPIPDLTLHPHLGSQFQSNPLPFREAT